MELKEVPHKAPDSTTGLDQIHCEFFWTCARISFQHSVEGLQRYLSVVNSFEAGWKQ
jgi:hypothetical protein